MINTIISSSVLILIILAIRFVFKGKINPMVQYGLWGLVALRLVAASWLNLHPVESTLSFMNAVNSAETTIRGASSVKEVMAGNAEAGAIDNAVLIMDNVQTGVMTSGEGISAAAGIDWQLVFMIIWAVGAIAIALWLIYVNLRFSKRIFENRTFLMSVRADNSGMLDVYDERKITVDGEGMLDVYDEGRIAVDGEGMSGVSDKGFIHRNAHTHIRKAKLLPVYVAKGLDSPCLMGYKGEVAIYVPSEVAADKKKLRFAIAHELCHYKHHDLIWSIVRGGLLAFYWFNPLVWVAAIMSKRDCELACDYGVLKAMGKEERLAYGRTLVDLISQSNHKSDVLQIATTMYGSTNGIKERVSMIARNKKMKAATLIAVLLISILAVGCTFTAASKNMAGMSNEAQAELEVFAIKWADAFSAGDADTFYELRNGLCENGDSYLTIGSVAENKEYWTGWSSPWPWLQDYVIDIEDDSTVHIYYNFRTSDPTITVAKETIALKRVGDDYKATHVTMKYFDSIESKADFEEAYKLGFPDFTSLASVYQTQADENIRSMKTILENPAAAAKHQLNLVGAEVSGTYEDPYNEPPFFVVKFKWNDGEVEVKLIQPMLIDENGVEIQASIWVAVDENFFIGKELEEYLNSIKDPVKKELLEKYFYLPSELIPEENRSNLDPLEQAKIMSKLSNNELKSIVDKMEANLPDLKEQKEREYYDRYNNGAGNRQHIGKIGAYMEEHSVNAFSPYYELLDFQISDYHEETVNGKVEAVFMYKIIHKNYDRDPDTVKYIKEAKESGNINYQQMYDEYLQPKEMNFDLKVVIDKNDTITLYSNVSPKGVQWEETKMTDYIIR